MLGFENLGFLFLQQVGTGPEPSVESQKLSCPRVAGVQGLMKTGPGLLGV